MREWARQNGLEKLYDEYLEECYEIANQCEEEGYPRCGSNYDLRVSNLQKSYPELFGDDFDDEEDDEF